MSKIIGLEENIKKTYKETGLDIKEYQEFEYKNRIKIHIALGIEILKKDYIDVILQRVKERRNITGQDWYIDPFNKTLNLTVETEKEA